MEHLGNIVLLFVLGACVGSFLNVVMYRLPQANSLWSQLTTLLSPPSHCPQCQTPLAWYDNIPVLGWVLLGGKCRYCKKPISPRYPIVEGVTGLLFVFYYVMLFMVHAGPSSNLAKLPPDSGWLVGNMASLRDDWPIFGLYLLLLGGLLAASVIDAELFIIPAGIPWAIGFIAIIVHAIVDHGNVPGALLAPAPQMALATGAAVGLLISIVLLELGILPVSFPEEDLLEVDRQKLHAEARAAEARGQDGPEVPEEFSPAQVRREIRKEMLFLMPPMVLAGASALLAAKVPAIGAFWQEAARHDWARGLMGSLLGGIVGAFIVWITRILGSVGFGREAMGLGDVHLMFAVGAVLGGGAAAVAFFVAPFCAILLALYMLITRQRHQLPYGPYLSLATALVMLFYCPVAAHLRPGMLGLLELLHGQ